jgi:two-component system chemotaxis response regulator CheB
MTPKNFHGLPACIGIGLSAGGLDAMKTILPALPKDFPSAILIVQHILSETPSQLEFIFSKICKMQVREAKEGDKISPGNIIFAPPDHHMIVNSRRQIELYDGPQEKYCKPAINPLFRSIAYEFGVKSMGIVLTGANDDGAEGLLHIARAGGTTVIQDPQDAEFFSMPKGALKLVEPDYLLSLNRISNLLLSIAATK